jgi:hypothetical protein
MTKKLSMMVGVLGVLAFLMAPPSWAQQQAPTVAPVKQSLGRQDRRYNPQAVETLAGKVVSMNRHTPRKTGSRAWETMVLNTGQGTAKVHLGPADYLDQQALKLAAGDQVELIGVRFTHGNRTLFIAGEVKKGDQVLKLRDEVTGRPLWFRGRKSKWS